MMGGETGPSGPGAGHPDGSSASGDPTLLLQGCEGSIERLVGEAELGRDILRCARDVKDAVRSGSHSQPLEHPLRGGADLLDLVARSHALEAAGQFSGELPEGF